MKRLYYLLLCTSLIYGAVFGKTIMSFLSQAQPISLTSFMDIVDVQDSVARGEFHAFYGSLIVDVGNLRAKSKKESRIKNFEQHGMNSLEIKRPQWAREISPILQKKEHPLYANAHTFVVRYAALEMFYEQKARQKNSTWAKVKSFVQETGQTVAGWFSFGRSKNVVT